MKRFVGILLAILILAVPAGCHKATPAPAASSAPVSSRAAEVSGAAVSSEGVPPGLKPGEAVSIIGEDNDFQLHGVDFPDCNTGWMIRDRYDSSSDTEKSQLLFTSDGGRDWSRAGTDNLTLDTVRFTGAAEGWAVSQEADPAVKTSSGSPPPFRYRILHTQDGGKSWVPQWKEVSVQSGDPSVDEAKPALWFDTGGNGFALTGGSLLKTENGGKTWAAVSFGAGDFAPVRIFFMNAKTGWTAGVSAGRNTLSVLYTSDGGRSWSLRFRKVYGNTVDDGPVGCAGINFLSAEEGWFLTSDMATMEGELYHTADAGKTWRAVTQVRSGRPYAGGLCFSDSKTGWIPFDSGPGPIDGGLSYTLDGGKTFRFLGDTGDDSEPARKIRNAEEVVFRNTQVGWAVGNAMNHGNYLLRTGDGGSSWEQVYPKPEPTDGVSFLNAEEGYGFGMLSDPGALLKTENGGKSWRLAGSLTGQYAVQAVSFAGRQEGWLLAVPVSSADSSADVLHTADGGKEWQKVGELGPDWFDTRYFRFFDAKNGVAVQQGKEYQTSLTSDGGMTWRSGSGAFGNGATADQAELGRFSGDATQWQYPPADLANAGGLAAALLPGGKGWVLAQTPPGGMKSRMELLTTADAGKVWNRNFLAGEFGADTFEDLLNENCMQFADAAHGWLLTAHGLLATDDGGRSWSWR